MVLAEGKRQFPGGGQGAHASTVPFLPLRLQQEEALKAVRRVPRRTGGQERLREFRKRPNYHALAELKREAKAKKRGRGYARLPSQLDPDGDRLRELEALRRPGEKDTA